MRTTTRQSDVLVAYTGDTTGEAVTWNGRTLSGFNENPLRRMGLGGNSISSTAMPLILTDLLSARINTLLKEGLSELDPTLSGQIGRLNLGRHETSSRVLEEQDIRLKYISSHLSYYDESQEPTYHIMIGTLKALNDIQQGYMLDPEVQERHTRFLSLISSRGSLREMYDHWQHQTDATSLVEEALKSLVSYPVLVWDVAEDVAMGRNPLRAIFSSAF